MAGKNINLFLIDGSVKGRVKCSLSNWTGLVYKIPRQAFSNCDSIKKATRLVDAAKNSIGQTCGTKVARSSKYHIVKQ